MVGLGKEFKEEKREMLDCEREGVLGGEGRSKSSRRSLLWADTRGVLREVGDCENGAVAKGESSTVISMVVVLLLGKEGWRV